MLPRGIKYSASPWRGKIGSSGFFLRRRGAQHYHIDYRCSDLKALTVRPKTLGQDGHRRYAAPKQDGAKSEGQRNET